MADQSTNKVGRHKNITPQEIRDTAVGIFLEKGYHAASTADICRALNISKPTLYWHFKNKEFLLYAIHKDYVDNILNPIILAMDKVEDPMERIRLFIKQYVDIICRHKELKLLVDENSCLDPEHQKYVVEHWAKLMNGLRKSIRDLKKNGIAKDINDGFAALNLIAMCTWPYNWFDYSRPEGIAELTHSIEQMFFHGILE